MPPPRRRRDGESNPSGDRSQSHGPLALSHLQWLCKKTARRIQFTYDITGLRYLQYNGRIPDSFFIQWWLRPVILRA